MAFAGAKMHKSIFTAPVKILRVQKRTFRPFAMAAKLQNTKFCGKLVKFAKKSTIALG